MKQLFDKNGTQVNLLQFEDIEWDIVNDNGYLKFSNGLLICFGKGSFKSTFTKNENMYRADIYNPFTFAIPFSNNPIVICGTAEYVDYNYGSIIGVIRDSTSINSVSLIRTNSADGATTLHYIAIGIWK